MVGIIRMTRTSQGVSMKELAQRMGVGVQAVSTLELNDERGAIKIETRDRALRALGKRALPIIVDAIPEEKSKQKHGRSWSGHNGPWRSAVSICLTMRWSAW
jgi:transcriptional regulator with XRE-family HTH domain